MRKEWRLLHGNQRLEGFGGVLVVIGVALQLEEKVIGETVWCIPAVEDGYLLILAVGELSPGQTIMLDVIDSLQIYDGSKGHQRMHH